MNTTQVLVLAKTKTNSLSLLVGLVGVATIAPLFHQQLFTGPIVNATLFAAVILLGAQSSLLVGLIPSVIALSVGTLPPVLAPMVPYIMVSNAILMLTFDNLRTKNYWLAVGCASLLKFLFLVATSSIVTRLLFKSELAGSVALMMSWPQLLTALAGGVLVSLVLGTKKFD